MVHRAIIFSANAHLGQLRKGTNLPYILHPLEVAQILSSIGASDITLVTGLLHDVLEDTLTPLKRIQDEFGECVARNVVYCTNYVTGSWRIRKASVIKKIRDSDHAELANVLCADKLSNLRSICFDYSSLGESAWTRFSAPKKDVLWYYQALGEAIEGNAHVSTTLKAEYSQLIRDLFTQESDVLNSPMTQKYE